MANVTWTITKRWQLEHDRELVRSDRWRNVPGADHRRCRDARRNNSTYTVTFNVPSCEHRQPDHHRRPTRRAAHHLKMTAGDTLIDSGGHHPQQRQSQINGAGTISVGGAISGGGTITAGVAGTSGGTLDLTGAGSIASGVALAIGTTGATTLQLDLAGGVISAAPITMNSGNQTLKISNGNLTINGGAQNVTCGTIVMAGGTITDASGLASAPRRRTAR